MAAFKHPVTTFGSESRYRETAIGILLALAAALSWQDYTANAYPDNPAVMVRVLHSSNGDGEIWPCG